MAREPQSGSSLILAKVPRPRTARICGPPRAAVSISVAISGIWAGAGAGLLVCVLRGLTSQLALWRLLTLGDLWSYPRFALSDQAVYDRLEAAGTRPPDALFAQTSRALAGRLAPYADAALAPFAAEALALDHTKLGQVARRLPALRGLPGGDPRLLPGQLAGLFDLRRQQWRTVVPLAESRQNEKVIARDLVFALPAGSLILGDLGFFAFPWFDDLTDRRYWYVSRLRQGTTYQVVHAFYHRGDTFDARVWLGKHRADRAKHAVRLVCIRHRGQIHRYITNVLDPAQLPLAAIARLYARCWDFELAANLVKRHLNLHLLRSAKDVVVRQQVWGGELGGVDVAGQAPLPVPAEELIHQSRRYGD